FIAAGAITGLHVCWSMLLGSVTAWMVFVPLLQHRGIIEGTGYAALVQWTLWGGVGCMVTSSLLSVALQWQTAKRAFTALGAMGKITQLVFGVLHPGNTTANLMSANVTAAAASSSADLLTDLKSGYLLGAHPRKQFIAQFAGIFVGTLVSVLSFRLLVPDASVLGSDQFPAPAAQTWRAVAIALSEGLAALGPVKIWSIAIGGLVGVILTLLPRIFPAREHLIPSPAGLGLAWTFHWYYG